MPTRLIVTLYVNCLSHFNKQTVWHIVVVLTVLPINVTSLEQNKIRKSHVGENSRKPLLLSSTYFQCFQ